MALKGQFHSLQELQIHIQTVENMKYVAHWVQCCLILHNIIIHFKSMLGQQSLVPWAQQDAQDLGRDCENMVVQVPIGSPGQLFCVGLMNSLFEVLGKPYVVNEGQE